MLIWPMKKKESSLKSFFIGASSASITTAIVEPLVYLKNRLQQQKKPAINPRIWYRGLVINASGFAPTMAIQNTVHSILNKEINQYKEIPQIFRELIPTIGAGCTSSIASCPRELLIIQQQNIGGNSWHVVKSFIQTHGSQKLLRGLTPIALRNTSFASCLFIVTPKLKNKISKQTNNFWLQNILPGMLAGMLSAYITHPLDTIKTYMQANINSTTSLQTIYRIYRGTTSKKTIGLSAFYQGAFPRVLAVGITMMTFSNIKDLMTKLLDKKL
jgi:hypothetical protein